jgi:hypothetical protein
MRDLLNLFDHILLEKSRGLLYREKGDSFFQGSKDNPTAEIVFDKAEYFPSMPGAYADYNEMAAAGQELFKQYPAIAWFNKPTGASKAFALLAFDGPQAGEKTYFGKFFNEIKPDMTGLWKNDELPGGWQLNKSSSLKGSYYRLKPADLFPPNSTFSTPKEVVAELQKNPKNNQAVPKIMPGMLQLLQGELPTFANTKDMASAVTDDLGETIGPIAMIQGMPMGTGAEAARVDILGAKGSFVGSDINFPAAKNNGLVDSYLFHPSGIEIGISSKGDKGATASVKNISDGIEVARKKNMNDVLKKYAEQVEVIEEVGKLSSQQFPIKFGVQMGIVTVEQARMILELIQSSAKTLNTPPGEDTDVLQDLMQQIKPQMSNPRYNVGYHILSVLARKVVTEINKDPKFGEACLTFLNISPLIQLHLKSKIVGNDVVVTGFESKYPPNFKGTVGLDASKVYAATGTNGRVNFAYNGGGDTDSDVEVDTAAAAATAKLSTADLDAAIKQPRLTGPGARAARTTSEPKTDAGTLGRERRRR